MALVAFVKTQSCFYCPYRVSLFLKSVACQDWQNKCRLTHLPGYGMTQMPHSRHGAMLSRREVICVCVCVCARMHVCVCACTWIYVGMSYNLFTQPFNLAVSNGPSTMSKEELYKYRLMEKFAGVWKSRVKKGIFAMM